MAVGIRTLPTRNGERTRAIEGVLGRLKRGYKLDQFLSEG